MNEKQFAKRMVFYRKESKMTQEELAERLFVSPQAVSKWENGHSLPETALLPKLARIFDIAIDDLFRSDTLVILDARYGDGIESVPVTKRMNRLIDKDSLCLQASSALLGIQANEERASYLTVKYQSSRGICFAVFQEGETVLLTGNDVPLALPSDGLLIVAGCYGSKAHHYDVMRKIQHYEVFQWTAYHANHETFPSNPANDQPEFLTLVYVNSDGIYMATCAEAESLEYTDGHTHLERKQKSEARFISTVPALSPFGEGMDCSWGASLTAALQAMGVATTYDEVMGVSGACYRLAFCSPTWDYSSVDGLVAYDYATPGYAAFGYTPEQYGHIEKGDRGAHRQKIAKEIRSNMPVLGINLRVAPEWGVICGYDKEGDELFCRTKYDSLTIANDPQFMKGSPRFDSTQISNPYNYLEVDSWPFLLCYFSQKRKPPTAKENLLASLEVLIDSMKSEQVGGYYVGFAAYEVWASDLLDDLFYETCDDEHLARRFSVNQFCALSLADARKAAYVYLQGNTALYDSPMLAGLAQVFGDIFCIAAEMYAALDSGTNLDGQQSREFWTLKKRHEQAKALAEMAVLEKEAHTLAQDFLAQTSSSIR